MSPVLSPVGRVLIVGDRRFLATLFLGVPGALLLHAVAYLIVYPGTVISNGQTGHGYLSELVPIFGLWGLLVLLWVSLASVRAAGLEVQPRRGPLTAVMTTVFLVQEFAERLAQNTSPTEMLTEPAVWLALAIAFPMAMMLLVVCRIGHFLIQRIIGCRCSDSVQRSVLWKPFGWIFVLRPVFLSVGRRGPPAFA